LKSAANFAWDDAVIMGEHWETLDDAALATKLERGGGRGIGGLRDAF
jgi:hypothetical protein